MKILSTVHNRRGLALLNLVFVFIFIGVLAVSGMKMYDSVVARGRINDSKSGLENQAGIIVAWAVKNGRLPTGTEYASLFGGTAPLDSWGRPVVYVYDDMLANPANAQYGGVCGRTSTNLSDSGTSLGFALVSGGDGATFDAKVNGVPLTASPSYVTVTSAAPLTNYQQDIYRAVPLEELKSKAGCYGQTGGRLAIINNELPTVCSGSATYPATLYANGGVAGYTWSLANPPAWLSLNTATGVFSPNPTITGTAGTYPLTITLSDGQANSVQRTYNLTVKSCGPPPPATPSNPIVFISPDPTAVVDNWNGGTPNDQGTNNTDTSSGKFNMTVVDGTLNALSVENGTTSNCIWFQRPLTLTGKKMGAYYQFTYTTGDGFVFTMVPTLGRTTIDSCDENAYMGYGSDIPGTTLIGAQFQVENYKHQPAPPTQSSGYICISTTSSKCTATGLGINSWLTGAPYHVRAELDATSPVYKLWLVSPSTWASSTPAFKTVFKNLTASSKTVIGTPTITKTITNTEISNLGSFFLGFTTGQHGNLNVNMLVNDLKFVLY